MIPAGTRSVWSQVKGGLRLTGIVLMVFAWLVLAFGGAAVAFSKSSYPRTVGWALMAVAGAILVLTAQRWVKAVPGLCAYGVLNGLLATASGHLGAGASRTIPRGSAAMLTLMFAGCAGLAVPLASRRLTVFDRVAMLGVFASFVLGVVRDDLSIPACAGIFVCLACTWANGRLRPNATAQRRKKTRGRPVPE